MPATERARRFMCSVCGGRAKGKKLPPKAVACEQCRAGIKKELRDELEHEPPTKRFLVKYATALASHLPAIVVQDAMRKARVTILESKNGSIMIEYQGKPLTAVPYNQMQARAEVVSTKEIQVVLQEKKDKYRPGPRHPWKSARRGFSTQRREPAYCG